MESVKKQEPFQLTLSKKEEKLRRRKIIAGIKTNKFLYVMILPGVLYFLIFRYLPMGDSLLLFKIINHFRNNGKSLGRFQTFHSFVYRTDILYIIKKYVDLVRIKYLRVFPMPIILSLLLNEVTNKRLKNGIQTIIYIPHFMSWVIIVSITYVFLNVDGGY